MRKLESFLKNDSLSRLFYRLYITLSISLLLFGLYSNIINPELGIFSNIVLLPVFLVWFWVYGWYLQNKILSNYKQELASLYGSDPRISHLQLFRESSDIILAKFLLKYSLYVIIFISFYLVVGKIGIRTIYHGLGLTIITAIIYRWTEKSRDIEEFKDHEDIWKSRGLANYVTQWRS